MRVSRRVKLLPRDVKIACRVYENPGKVPGPFVPYKYAAPDEENAALKANAETYAWKESDRNEVFPLLMLPGTSSTKERYHGLASILCEEYGYTVVAMDNRGTGESGGPQPAGHSDDRTLTLADMAADCLALADALELPKFSLFGSSIGGCVAQHVALAQPQRLHKLLLACTHFGGPKYQAPGKRYRKLTSRPVPPVDDEDAWGEHQKRLFSMNFHHEFLQTEEFKALLESFKEAQRLGGEVRGEEAQSLAMSEFIETGLECELMDRFELDNDFGVNTLVLTGDSDQVVPVENSFKLRVCFPGSSMSVFANAGHMFIEEKTEAVAKEIDEFLMQVHV